MKTNTTMAALAGLVLEEAPPEQDFNPGKRSGSLEMAIHQRPGGVVARLSGSAGMEVAPCLRYCLERLAGDQTVVLDLAGLDFIGSEGLAAIVHSYLKIRQLGGRLCLVAPRPAVLGILQRTRLTELLPIYPSAQQALRLEQPVVM